MVTLRDFINLDYAICGLELNVRDEHKLKETHVIGLGAWPGNARTYVKENVYRELCTADKEILIYIHPEPINFNQTKEKYKGITRPWGVLVNKIPKQLLDLEIDSLRPFTARFRDKQKNGTYYIIDLNLDNKKPYVTPVVEEIETDNLTIDDIFDITQGE